MLNPNIAFKGDKKPRPNRIVRILTNGADKEMEIVCGSCGNIVSIHVTRSKSVDVSTIGCPECNDCYWVKLL